jgi:hypothetical protein
VLRAILPAGIDDFVCFQNYIPACCCLDFPNMCRGSKTGLCLEGCCCPIFSLSIARIHLMDSKQMRPDPMDWQLIHCSNALQVSEAGHAGALPLAHLPARSELRRGPSRRNKRPALRLPP